MKEMLRPLRAGKGKTGFYYSLAALEEKGLGKISRLPASIRIVLESVVRNCRIDTPNRGRLLRTWRNPALCAWSTAELQKLKDP